MDQAWTPEQNVHDADRLQRWSPPILDDLNFGDDYDFEGSPMYPSWLDDCESAQVPDDSTESMQAAGGVQLRAPEFEPIDTFSSVSRVYWLTKQKTNGASHLVQGHKISSEACRSRARGDRRLVRIAPKPALPKRQKSPSPSPAYAMMAAGCYTFTVDLPLGASSDSAKPQKRGPYAKKTCLRCQSGGDKCSGGFPCERCLGLWARKSAQAKGLAWMACFDSNIQELNPLPARLEMLAQHITAWQTRSQSTEQLSDRKKYQLQESDPLFESAFWVPCRSEPASEAQEAMAIASLISVGGYVNRQWLKSFTENGQRTTNVGLDPADANALAKLFEVEMIEPKRRLISRWFNRISGLLIKIRRSTATASERRHLFLLLSVVPGIMGYLLFPSLVMSTCVERHFPPSRARQWESCLAREQHLAMYCKHWVGKLASMQSYEEITC